MLVRCRHTRSPATAAIFHMTPDPASAIFNAIVPAPFGALGIRTAEARVAELVYLPPAFAEKAPDNAAAEAAARQVAQYLLDPDFVFDLPLQPVGTEFQRKVWARIGAIPRGSVRTYGYLAKLLESHPRAVGQACGANWFPLIVPCHRVTAAGGLGGFSNHDDEHGFHLSVKRWLLRHEGATASSSSPWQQQAIWP
jgi:methylated-DNA-[protein]-cysteine S-methyltransferase